MEADRNRHLTDGPSRPLDGTIAAVGWECSGSLEQGPALQKKENRGSSAQLPLLRVNLQLFTCSEQMVTFLWAPNDLFPATRSPGLSASCRRFGFTS